MSLRVPMQLRVSEIFYSIQGEGVRAGHPSVFIRIFGCNFRCPGFGMPKGQLSTEPDEIANEVLNNPDKYPTYESLPLARTGCDSYPSWHPKLKDYSPELTLEQIIEKIESVIPEGVRKSQVDIVFTGGEPLLKCNQISINELLVFNEEYFKEFNSFTFETNGSQPILSGTMEVIDKLLARPLIISMSPKLSCSGVPRAKAIKPNILTEMFEYVVSGFVSNAYLKFVVSPEDIEGQLDEINDIVSKIKYLINEYVDFEIPVYLMPEGGTEERYNTNLKKISEIAMNKGYVFCPRLHVTLFGNSWAT